MTARAAGVGFTPGVLSIDINVQILSVLQMYLLKLKSQRLHRHEILSLVTRSGFQLMENLQCGLFSEVAGNHVGFLLDNCDSNGEQQ